MAKFRLRPYVKYRFRCFDFNDIRITQHYCMYISYAEFCRNLAGKKCLNNILINAFNSSTPDKKNPTVLSTDPPVTTHGEGSVMTSHALLRCSITASRLCSRNGNRGKNSIGRIQVFKYIANIVDSKK